MIQRPVYLLLLGIGLLACSGNSSENKGQTDGTTSAIGVPVTFAGSWINDIPARTPPDPEPDHYDRTEYEVQISNGQANLTKWTAALDIKTRKEWFRNKINGPLTCTYIADRECLACGTPGQSVKDSLFIVEVKLVNRSPLASNRSAAGQGSLSLTRKSE